MTPIVIPDFALVVLIGISGSGKSTFARQHFLPTEIISSDTCRGLVSDDENNQAATDDAFAVLHFIAAKRLERHRLCVIDATNVQPEARKQLLTLAREYHALPVALVLDVPEKLASERNKQRPDRAFGDHVIQRQQRSLRRSLGQLQREGFRRVSVLRSAEEIEQASVLREPLLTDRRSDHGPFDIIGDVHGCYAELLELLAKLGYDISAAPASVVPPPGRKAVFLGDLVDRGPRIPDVLRLVMGMVAAGSALCVPGNHDVKLLRALRGKRVQITHGLADSLAQLEQEPPEFREAVATFIDSLVSHYLLDAGNLVVAHAGMQESMAGRASRTVREFAMYGETTGETDEFGLPVRFNWAAEYRGLASVVYGHTPNAEPQWLNRTINIDTGCVFGGALSALQYPEMALTSVPAEHTYAAPIRPLQAPEAAAPTMQQQDDSMLAIDDVLALDAGLGKRLIDTRLQRGVQIRAENAAAALEVMSRFAIDPRWLIYLPPTMAPVATSQLPDLLEHPAEAFSFYRQSGVAQVICEEKHMGSRAIVIVCRTAEAARSRFGIDDGAFGCVYTRTGRRFFTSSALETQFLERMQAAINSAGLWADTDWMLLDCELMPWSAKAQELLQHQYAATGSAASHALHAALAVLQQTAARLPEAAGLLELYQGRASRVTQYIDAYRRYCWEVSSVDDLRLAPFHLLATASGIHTDQPHLWHMTTLARLQQGGDPLLHPTRYQLVDVNDEASMASGSTWWEQLTAQGGEGMVVKPLDFIVQGQRGLVQPAVKVRGREYLRIIYGPEYTAPEQLEQLRSRGLGAKRAMALREFALGIEALERFGRQEPLRRIHECVFGVLALESEPVDPRL